MDLCEAAGEAWGQRMFSAVDIAEISALKSSIFARTDTIVCSESHPV